jgi:hypothetical protein
MDYPLPKILIYSQFPDYVQEEQLLTSIVINPCIIITLRRCQPLRVSQGSNYDRFQMCKGGK